ncbi:MAG: sigma-54 dependent transcriptional regulator [Sterolibacterium sp.]
MNSSIKLSLCLIEDDDIVGEALAERFELEGYDCVWFRTGREALLSFTRHHFDVVVSDIRLPDMSGETLFIKLLDEATSLPPYLFITGHGEIDQAVRLLKLGAADYIKKPFDIESLLEKIGALVTSAKHTKELPQLGLSPVMRSLTATLEKISGTNSNILITGESGVGKEEVARTLHRLSNPENKRPFVAVNCGALTETLLEAELFGYQKGAFTGAIGLHKGVFEQADGGTLFLDEIGDMSQPMQVKLLRAIQERQITRIGGETHIAVDLRIVCATHQDLKQMVENGKFREDLYYRINVVHLRVPPLRERSEDVLWLARTFLEEESDKKGSLPRTLSKKAERVMLDYPWPGNVRELKHAIERACLLSPRGVIQPEYLFEELPAALQSTGETLNEYLKVYEREYILRMLTINNWHVTKTAAALGISRKNMWERMKRFDIQGNAKE